MEKDLRPQTAYEKAKFSAGGNMKWILLRGSWGLAIDTFLLRLTGYSLMTKQYALAHGLPYQPTLLLTTIGAKTGLKRTVGLPYFSVEGALVVRGSNGGGPTDPHWVHNIRKSGDVTVHVKGKKTAVKAHVASGEERVRLFGILDEMSPGTSMYQKMCAPRELPLVVIREV